MGAVIPAQAEAYISAQKIIKNPSAFPACRTKGGLRVRYVFADNYFGIPASADIFRDEVTGKKEALVFYASEFMRFTREQQIFVAQHECAHHRLGHTGEIRSRISNETKKRMELDADCAAARALKHQGFSRQSFERAISIFLVLSEDKEHYDGKTRMARARECFSPHP